MRKNGQVMGPFKILIPVIMGMTGELFIVIPPFGTVAMLDFAALVLAIPILCRHWGWMGRCMRRCLMFSFAWTAAAMLANLFNFYEIRYWVKCVTIVSSSWTLLAVAYAVLKNNPAGYLWYLVGAGIGGWIGLYHFRNGAIEGFATKGFGGVDLGDAGALMEKQVYPMIARGIVYGCVLPFFIWWRKLPAFGVILAMMIGGFWMLIHGGSRSNFGMFCASAGAGFVVVYGGRAFRRLAKNPALMIVIVGVSAAVVFGAYQYLVKSGAMGEDELRKYEGEFGSERKNEKGALSGRAGLDYATKYAVQTCGLGHGTHLQCHSVWANSLACEGLAGASFWLYFMLLVFWWVRRRMPYAGKYVPFIVLTVLSCVWDVIGSPYAFRHRFFFLMALIALSKDNQLYGVGTLYDKSLAMVRERRQ